MRDPNDLWCAVHDGAVKRIRPKTMTVVTTFIGLVPLLWASGAGADTMRRLAAPMIGGLATSFVDGAADLPGDLLRGQARGDGARVAGGGDGSGGGGAARVGALIEIRGTRRAHASPPASRSGG